METIATYQLVDLTIRSIITKCCKNWTQLVSLISVIIRPIITWFELRLYLEFTNSEEFGGHWPCYNVAPLQYIHGHVCYMYQSRLWLFFYVFINDQRFIQENLDRAVGSFWHTEVVIPMQECLYNKKIRGNTILRKYHYISLDPHLYASVRFLKEISHDTLQQYGKINGNSYIRWNKRNIFTHTLTYCIN